MYDYDLLVIGSGSAGFSAAHAAKGQGRKIGMIESERMGGECPNWACVPTKVLLKSAKAFREARDAKPYGVHAQPKLAFEDVMRRREDIVSKLGGPRIERVADQLGIDVIRGFATFLDEHTLQVGDKQYTAEKFIIATGATTFVPPIPGLDSVDWIGFRDAVMLDRAPQSMIVIGGGPVGCEFSTFYATVGTKVTLIQGAPAVLHREEPEVSEIAQGALGRLGIDVQVGAEVIEVKKTDTGVWVKARIGKELKEFEAEKLLIATGKTSATAGLGTKAAGVELDARGTIVVNSELRTNQKHIWAAGDVNGGMQFTHVAHYEGSLAGFNAFAKTAHRKEQKVVPRVTFVDPEVASVGLTEVQAAEEGAIFTGVFQMRGLGRAFIDGHTEGLVKLIVEKKTRRIVGGHVCAERAGEMVHEIALAMYGKLTVDDLANMIHAYPTYSEAITGAASIAVANDAA